MTPAQRQAAFDRHLVGVARSAARRLGLTFMGTIRKLPPPPLPGEDPGATRYYLNAGAPDGSRAGLVELGAASDAALARAEHWVASGEGAPPFSAGARIR
ncbi:MAG TPA: hypothetical protein VGG34_05675 [Opitutaceae bacterium]